MKLKSADGCKIVIGSFAINFMLAGTIRLSAIYYVESLTRYNVNRKDASFPFFLTFIVRNLSGPFVGYLFQIFGMKSMILIGCTISTASIGACFFAEDILAITLLWGLMFGLGYVLANHMLPQLLNELFPESKSKVNGISTSGGSIGGILLPLLVENSIHLYGVSGSFLLLSAAIAHTIPAAMLLKNPFDEEKPTTDKCNYKKVEINPEKAQNHKPDEVLQMKSTNEHECELSVENSSMENRKQTSSRFSIQSFKIFLDLPFILLLFINAGTLIICFTVFTIILDLVRDKGVGDSLEIYYVVCLPIFDLCGRFGSGVFIDKNYLTATSTTFICGVCASLSFIAFIFVEHYVLVMLCEFFVSIFIGALFVLMIALIPECIEEDKRTMAMASRLILYPPFSLGISPLIGHFRGTHGSYDGVLYVLSGISIVCGCMTYFIPFLTKRRKTKKSKETIISPTDGL